MKLLRFPKENCPGRKDPTGQFAFGAAASSRQHFGRDNSPRFGGRAALAKDERGVAAVEYAVICALIVVAIVAGVGNLGGGVQKTWSNVDHQVNDATSYSTS